jgi:hypothetical protein
MRRKELDFSTQLESAYESFQQEMTHTRGSLDQKQSIIDSLEQEVRLRNVMSGRWD